MASSVLTLYPVQYGDIEPLTALWCDGWHAGHADIVPTDLLRHRDHDSFRVRIERDLPSFFVVKQADTIAGFVRIVGEELDQFYVAPDLIGTGTAAPLMSAAEDLLRARGVQRAHLIASAGNDRAIRFYEKQGWENCGAQMAEVTTLEAPFALQVIRLEKTL